MIKAMGYGVRGDVVGSSHDGGIDGIIYQDKLGIETIYLQAKRYSSGTIGRPKIQKFIGSLIDTNKGIFITTSDFTTEAIDYVKKYNSKTIVLINGEQLVHTCMNII